MTLSLGLFISTIGTLLLFWSMTHWEASLGGRKSSELNDSSHGSSLDLEEYRIAKLSLEEAQQMQIRLLAEIDSLTAELQKVQTEKANIKKLTESAASEIEELKLSYTNQLEQQQQHIRDLHETIAEQKAILEKKQHQSSLLESKVGDLTYEIKTLLQLAEAHSGSLFSSDTPESVLAAEPTPPPVKEPIPVASSREAPSVNHTMTIAEGSQQLRRCLDIAQKITGSQRFGSQLYTFSESPAESFALDLRRLCERLRSDTSSTHNAILVYSPKENQILFASNQIRDLTGWSPEKFIQTFGEILQDEGAWKQGVSGLSMRSEVQTHLSLKTRTGQTNMFQVHLGTIPTGIFRNHVIAILYMNAPSPAGAL